MKKKHPIEALIEQGEHQQLDFKFEVSDSKKIARTLSAFDNGNISGVRSEEEYYMIEAASKMYTQPEVPFEATRWEISGKTVLEIYIAPSADKPHLAPDKEDKYKAYIRVADENILANEILVLSWEKKRRKDGTLVKISKPVERLFSYLEQYPYINAGQLCRIGHVNYYTAKNILSDLLAIDALEYVVVDKRIFYQRVPGNDKLAL